MATLLKSESNSSHSWKVLTLKGEESPLTAKLPAGPVLVPLAVWQARREDLIRREWEQGVPYGVWIDPSVEIAPFAQDLADFGVIGIQESAAQNGLHTGIAPRLREQYGFKGEIRVLGNASPLKDFSASAAIPANQAHQAYTSEPRFAFA